MAEVAMSLKGMRAQMAAAAQAQADERRSQAFGSTGSEEAESTASSAQTQGGRPVIDGAALRIDDKLRVAKERREEQEKQQATRESQVLDRERKTKQQYERQMEERQKKLEDQRRKEAQRRTAAEEKRKLKQEEEKEHYEAVLRRSVERSQKLDQRQKRWSWGGGLTAASGDSGGAAVVTPSSPVKSRRKGSAEVVKSSTSALILKQQGDSVTSKRLSSSSAAITKSPEKSTKPRSSSLNRLHSNTSHPAKDPHKLSHVEQTGPSQQKRSSSLSSGVGGRLLPSPKTERKAIKDEQARRPQAIPPENGTISRLLTPTRASLARSKSSAALSAEGSDSQESRLYPRSASASPLHLSRGPLRSHSTDRQKGSPDGSARGAQKSEREKRFSSPGGKRPASPSGGPSRRRSPSPVAPPSGTTKRPASPTAAKPSPRTRPPSPSSAKQRPPSPSPQPGPRPPPIQRPALTPTGPPTLRKRDSKAKEGSSAQPVTPLPADAPPATTAPSGKSKDDAKAIAGTTSAETAAKMLAENRRLARELKEKEEQLRVQREEEERLRKEEEMRLAEEQRVRREEEEKIRAEEMKILQAEQARLSEEERVRMELEELEKQAELQKEREEAEARALEEAEKQRQERERIMKQNQQERMQRRKRIEEIMKRTRKTDQNDDKRDDEKGMLDENEEEDSEAKEDEPKEDCAYGEAEFEAEGWSLPGEVPMAEQEGGMNGKSEMDNKENRSILSQRDPAAVSPTPKALMADGSEILNQDSKMGLQPGLNGRVGPWSLEELIDLHPKAGPLISTDGAPEKPRVAFEDKGSAVGALHPGQPIEALSEM